MAQPSEADRLEDESWQAEMRVHALPTEPYVGMTLTEARVRASAEGRTVDDITGQWAVTADFVPTRIRVRLDGAGRVLSVDSG